MSTPTSQPRRLFGILSMPAGNQYAAWNGQMLPVVCLLGTGAADLAIARRGGGASPCFAPHEFRLVDEAANDVTLAEALAGGYATGWLSPVQPASDQVANAPSS